ncbi:putative ribonuclease H-like domain-containing protein [Tanacetum coccineum]
MFHLHLQDCLHPPSIDLSNSGLEEFQKPEFEGHDVNVNKSVSENSSKKTKNITSALIIEDWVSDCDEDESKERIVKADNVQHKPEQANEPRQDSQNPRNKRTNFNEKKSHKLGVGFQVTKRACFVCGSFNHQIKDCDFHEKKMVQKPVLNNEQKGTAVLTKSSLVPLSTAKQSSSKVAVPVSTARPIRTDAPKSFVNVAKPRLNAFQKSHLPSRRPFYHQTSLKNRNLYNKVNTTNENSVNTANGKRVISVVGKQRNNAVKSSACWIWRPTGKVIDYVSKDSGSYICKKFEYGDPQVALKDTGIFDSGCSRHMTGNKSYLTDYQDYDDGFVTFAVSSKGGKITSKGKIRTGKLDFKDVYFVKELKFNLFSVSQMCDRKNSVLFTESECVILSPEFKLPDESQVMLKILRKDNMYSLDLKNVVPTKGLTCLFAKATNDESKMWHRRLGHINFKNINKLVKGNLVRGFPSKLFQNDHSCVACQKGNQHKATWIKREFSNARTPQQNRVAERKNRTLIEAARTMVLVTKPHNKTPYELLIGRTPIISFMRSFGYPVTILNTLDHLGKFDGKADEGFLVGYSINNKAFRVFNSRTRKVEENLHASFLENKPNVVGIGPTWLFDIDSLTNSMNYQPVSVGNRSNGYAGLETNSDAGQARKEQVPDQEYILLPLMPTNSYVSSSSKEAEPHGDAGKDAPEQPSSVEGDPTDDLGSLNLQVKDGDDVEINNNTNSINTISPTVNTAGMMLYEEMWGGDEGAEADYNNLESQILVSPIPSTRVNKDHPKDQIIGEVHSAVQTRKDESCVEAMQEELLQFQLQKVWILVDFPFGKKVIGTKWVFRNKRDERGIVVKNKVRLVAQGHKQEEGIDYDEVFTLVSKIEAIKLFLAFASYMGFPVYQMDVKSAFLYATIGEEVYVHQPPGFVDPAHPNKVYKVKQQPNGIFISQDKYVADILKKFDFCSIKSATTPIESNKPLVKDEDGVDVDVHVYMLMISSLMYLTASRPDIMFDVCTCARFQVTPKASHLHAVKRIFRYLKHQPKLGLWYPRDSPFELEAFSDSDYGGASIDRKSTTGGCQFLGRILLSWQCKKQTIVANYTTEAEYVATASCCGQVLWIQNQLMDYGFNFMNTKIHIGNKSTICIVKNPVYHSRTKHIEIRHHFIRDGYEKRLIDVLKIHTDNNVADLLTKGFDVTRTSMDLRLDGSCAGCFSHNWFMTTLKYNDKHNQVAFLKKPTESEGFHEIVDFLKGTSLRYALSHNPTIYDSLVKQFWQTATVKTLANGTQELVASINNHEYTITEASVRSKLQLTNATGITNSPDAEIFEGLTTLGPKSGGWDQFGSSIATALICLSSNRVYNFSKMIFDGMVNNLESKINFLMYPRGFAGNHVPLLPAMLVDAAQDQADEATPTSVEVEAEGATTTIPSLDAGLESGNIHESPLRSHEAPIPEGHTSGSAEDSLKLKELSELVPKLEFRIDSLEKELQETKQTLGSVVITLVKKSQGRKIRDTDDDPLVSLAKASMDESAADFITPSNSGEAQKKDISPTTIEAARTLTQVASEGLRTYIRRTKSTDKGKNINTGLNAEATINTGSSQVKSGSSQVKSGSVNVNADKGQREGKAPMTVEEEDWDVIRAKIEENADLTKNMLGKDLPKEDFAKRMVDIINQRKKYFAEERAKAKRKIKEKFDNLVKQIDNFVPMNFEATKAKMKRYGEELQTRISKKQKIIHVSESAEDVAKVASKEQEEDSETDKEEHTEAIDVTPIATKANVVVNWKIFQQEISREDLTKLYRLIMHKYGVNRPENVHDRALWSDLRTMFDPPLSEDAIWSLPLKYPLSKEACQMMLKMKLLDGKMNEVCYQLLKMIEKQAGLSKCWFHYHTSNGHQFTMFNRHKNWLVLKQMDYGKDFSNPFMADSLPKMVSPRHQESRPRNQDSLRKTVNVEETSSKAMVAIDGAGFNWSFMADEEVLTNMALMAFSDLNVLNDKTCSNTCLKNYETLKTQYDSLRVEFNKFEFDLANYKRGLASVEEQLAFYKKNESIEITDLNALLLEKVLAITTLENELRKSKGKDIVDNAAQMSKATTSAPGLYKLDQVTLPHKELLGYVRDTCPVIHNPSEKSVSTKLIKKKKTVRSMFDATHDLCFLEFVSNMNAGSKSKSVKNVKKKEVVQIVLWYLDSGCSKHMTRDRSQLTNFVHKFLGTVKFGNDQVAKIMRYGDYQIGNVTISKVYYMEGLGHNLLSVSQFCDSNLEVAFKKHSFFVRNLEGVDLLSGYQETNLYTLSIGDMMASSPIWKRKKQTHKPKSKDTNQQKTIFFHMDLCGPMHVTSVNGKKYILVIVDDYSRFTWVKFLASKDEALDFIIKFLKMIQVRLNATIRNVRTDNGTEFANQTLSS